MKLFRKRPYPPYSVVNPLLWIPALFWYVGADVIARLRRDYLVMYGVCLYVGAVGSGKTMGMTERALRLKRRDPRIKIWSNYGFKGVDHIFTDLRELEEVPSYTIVCLSEASLFANSRDWANFPVGAVEMLTQNRKYGKTDGGRPPGVLLLWDVQDPQMVDVNVRRLTNWVVHCSGHFDFGNGPRLMLQRWCRPFDYFEREDPHKVPVKSWFGYIATDRLRNVYDSWIRLKADK
ncbi:MAG: hypothetical protein QXT77_09020 [Candidatus Methanomethylicaceae archaeon]